MTVVMTVAMMAGVEQSESEGLGQRVKVMMERNDVNESTSAAA